eukprot:scaffold499_cov335-Pavlova_lutheri.AAC.42
MRVRKQDEKETTTAWTESSLEGKERMGTTAVGENSNGRDALASIQKTGTIPNILLRLGDGNGTRSSHLDVERLGSEEMEDDACRPRLSRVGGRRTRERIHRDRRQRIHGGHPPKQKGTSKHREIDK